MLLQRHFRRELSHALLQHTSNVSQVSTVLLARRCPHVLEHAWRPPLARPSSVLHGSCLLPPTLCVPCRRRASRSLWGARHRAARRLAYYPLTLIHPMQAPRLALALGYPASRCAAAGPYPGSRP